ncbi:MAG TPA: alpha/beta hydrolase [Candidatus Dormibacteraeota bacterium]
MTFRPTPNPVVGGVVVVEPATGRGVPAGATMVSSVALRAELQSAGLEVALLQVSDAALLGEADSPDGTAPPRLAAVVDGLAQRCGAHGDRIVIIAFTTSAEWALQGMSREPRIRGTALIAARLGPAGRDLLRDWPENPILCVATAADHDALRDMSAVWLASTHARSGLVLLDPSDLAPGDREPAAATVARWVRAVLTGVAVTREVTFESADGWKLFGNLTMPGGGAGDAAGVVLLHSGRSDRFAMLDLERTLASSGLAVLNIDWRGRGRSTNKGSYFDLSPAEKQAGGLDAAAAIDFLAAQPGVDEQRLAAVGVVHGAEYAVRAGLKDPRVKALVLLTGYVPRDERERGFLTGGRVQVLYVSGTGHRSVTAAMRELHRATPPGRSRFVLYSGGAIGYQLLELDDRLGPDIARWLGDTLGADDPAQDDLLQPPAPLARSAPPAAVSVAPRGPWPGPEQVRLVAADGWELSGILHGRGAETARAAVVLVPGSKHERDAFGPDVLGVLRDAGLTVLAIDVRGRGSSQGALRFADMAPGQRQDVRLDVAAAIDRAAAALGGSDPQVCVVVEQDSVGPALLACAADGRVTAVCVLSPRLMRSIGRTAMAGPAPLLCVASLEDRRGVRDAIDLYADSTDSRSRLSLLDGAGIGTTMLSTWRFEHPDQPPLEQAIAGWLASVVQPDGS